MSRRGGAAAAARGGGVDRQCVSHRIALSGKSFDSAIIRRLSHAAMPLRIRRASLLSP